MARQRTMRDVFALVSSNEPINEENSPGSTVYIQTEKRLERCQEFGWITDDAEEVDGGFEVELTSTGAALLNYFAHALAEGSVATDIEQGISSFVEKAMQYQSADVNEWDVVEMSEDELVIRSDDAERTYELVEERAIERAN